MSTQTPGPTCRDCVGMYRLGVIEVDLCPFHAAASVLLEALERACESIMPDRFGDGRPAWYDEARAAILLAKGASQ